jgi:putative SOS response-associated peptidase YedK
MCGRYVRRSDKQHIAEHFHVYPFAIALKSGEPYAFAGLWERWHDKAANAELLTFSVITTDANAIVDPLHDRMPVILPERDYSRWLDVDSPQLPVDLLRPYAADQMTAWEVDKRIGNVRNDSPELLKEQSTQSKEPSLFDDVSL